MEVKLIDITERPIEKIYKAYRICYSKDCWGDIKIKSDKEMIDFIVPLMLEQHTSPLEHVSFSFAITGISRACLTQLTRHRTFKFNVQSQRYVNGSNFDFVIPDLDYIKDKDTRETLKELIKIEFENSQYNYSRLISFGVRKEDARAILPQATTCNLVVTMDLNKAEKMCSCSERDQGISF